MFNSLVKKANIKWKSSAPGLQWFIQPAVHAICHHQWHGHGPGAHHGHACGLRLDKDQVQGARHRGGEEDVLREPETSRVHMVIYGDLW